MYQVGCIRYLMRIHVHGLVEHDMHYNDYLADVLKYLFFIIQSRMHIIKVFWLVFGSRFGHNQVYQKRRYNNKIYLGDNLHIERQ